MAAIALLLVGGVAWWWHFKAVALHATSWSFTTVVQRDTVVGPLLFRGASPAEGSALVVLSPTQLRQLTAALDAMKAAEGQPGPRAGHTDQRFSLDARWGTRRLSESGMHWVAVEPVLRALHDAAAGNLALFRGSPLPAPRP